MKKTLPALDILVLRKLDDYVLKNQGDGAALAQRIRGHYEEDTPLKGHPVKFTQTTDVKTRKNSDWIKLKGYISRNKHLPGSLVVPILAALPEKDGRDVLAELCGAFDLSVVPRPKHDVKDIDGIEAAAKFMKETGDAFSALSVLLADKKIDGNDCAKAIRKALLELGEVSAALEPLRAMLMAALPTADVVELKKA